MKRVTSLALLVLFILSVFPFRAHAQEIIERGATLTLQQCLDIAERQQPTIAAARYVVDVNRSRVGEAQSNYYPQISADASYSRVKPLTGAQRAVTTGVSGLSQSNATTAFNQYSGGMTLNQNIYDFGRTSSQVDISRLNVASSRSDLQNTLEQVFLNVKQAYYGVLQAKYNRIVAEDTLRQTQQHLEQAKGFYEVGTQPKFDVTKAEVDVSTAQLNLIRAGNNYKIAVVNLNNAMGVPDAPEYTLSEELSFAKYEMTLEEAVQKAYDNRPDLKSLVIQRNAAVRNIDLARSGYYPALTGNGAYNVGGSEFPLEKGWNVGVSLSIPIFNGFLTKSQVSQAKANLSVLKANEESLRQTISLEVQQAYVTLRSAEEAIPTAKLGVEQAKENLDIANGRYAAGVGNPIEVTDAEVSLANARLTYIQALYADKVAIASLEKAMGMK
jgi:outer membrane protein